MTHEPVFITVAICTHDRAQSLRVTLESLAGQAGVTESWELLVVENACADSTRDVVGEFEGRLPVRLVSEPTLGLSHARNRTLGEARGELLIFTDDDVRLAPAWLAAYCGAARRYPKADYLAGRILAEMVEAPPRWFREETRQLFDGILVEFDLGQESRLHGAEDPLPVGASFGLRRSLFERNGAFRIDLGVRGTQNGRGEETEYLLRARFSNAVGVYVADAICWHPVDWKRFTLRRLYGHGVASGIAYRKIHARDQHGSWIRGATQLIRGVWQLLKGRGDRFRRCVVNFGIEIGMKSAEKERGEPPGPS